jgi:hypothetical protein
MKLFFSMKLTKKCGLTVVAASLTPFAVTSRTGWLMHANRLATTGTRPLGFFGLYEIPQSASVDIVQIFNHAHAVVRTISSVQTAEPCTGKTLTSRAEFLPVAAHDFAISDFAIPSGPGFIRIIDPAAGTSVSFALISHAKRAIHPAGSNKLVGTQVLR